MKFAETYGSIKDQKGFSVRSAVRNVTLDGLHLIEKFKNSNALSKNRIQFLYIHHVFKDEISNLKELLNFLSEDHFFISYSEAVNLILNNTIDKPYICISSDDGLKNNLYAAEIFDLFGIKACFFICPGIIGETDYNKINEFCARRLIFPAVEFLEWSDIDFLLKKGHEIGSHTMTHINCAEVSTDVLEEEFRLSYEIIKQRCGAVQHFAYPYGRYSDFSRKAADMVFATGYQSCSSAERGCHIEQPALTPKESLLIRRDNIVLDWRLSHIRYFLNRNARTTSLQKNNFPY